MQYAKSIKEIRNQKKKKRETEKNKNQNKKKERRCGQPNLGHARGPTPAESAREASPPRPLSLPADRPDPPVSIILSTVSLLPPGNGNSRRLLPLQ
jgi:hypothetical protein